MALFVDIEKRTGDFLLNVKFEAGDEALSLLGASGCGKSMTLKCIAGIEKPDRGRIVLNGVTLFDSEKGINLPPQERRVGFMFQQGALFPNMNVLDNVICGIRTGSTGKNKEKAASSKKAVSRPEKEQIAREMLAKMHLVGKEKAKPATLSGGEQQRAALARILVNEPEILLLDEPFSALDSHLRFELERVLREVIKELGKTVIFVSHNRDEAFRITEKLAIMNNGAIEVFGDKKEVFAAPLTKNAAIMTGCKNVAEITGANVGSGAGSEKRCAEQTVRASADSRRTVFVPSWGISLKVRETGENESISAVGVRMHDILPGPGENEMSLAVEEVVENPFSYTIMLNAGHGYKPIGMELDKSTWEQIRADRVTVHIPAGAVLVLRDGVNGS